MSFATDWLDLRESADTAARDAGLLARVRAFLAETERPVIVDLGAGTGSTRRALDIAAARWRLVDNDPALLAEAKRRAGEVETVELDLTRVEAIPLDDARLVTASALFDLASAAWIDALVARLAGRRVGLYAALSYDGVLDFTPSDPGDDLARDGFNGHQQTEKSFGPALGPRGGAYLAEVLDAHGYEVMTGDSPWRLGPQDAALQRELIAGIADAAGQMGMADAPDWLARRLDAIDGCVVGHVDVLALPRG